MTNPYKIHPAGYYILVEVEAVEDVHEGTSIVMVIDEQKREQGGRDVGKILEFGPICFQGYADCKTPEDWGCKVGDVVEFNRYDGKVPRLAENNPELANLRIINDNDIIAVMEQT
jgi:co-chaperonin GroES (HSP10)